MGLVKRGKYWWLDIRIDGKRIRRSLKTTNKLVALDNFKKIKEDLLREYKQNKNGIHLDEIKDQYLSWAKTVKPASFLDEKYHLEIIFDFFKSKGIEFLDEIQVYHVEQLKSYLLKRKAFGKAKKPDQTITKATCNRYLQLLKTLFYRAKDWGLYPGENPVAKVKMYRESKRPQNLTRKNVEEILEVAKKISEKPRSKAQACLYDVLLVALNTGMRRSEILNLKWKDIKGGELIIRGKGDKWRTIPINETVREVLESRKSLRQKGDEYVFDIPNRNYSAVFRRSYEQIKKRTGINFHLHMFRHFFASELLRQGVDLQTISDILGHSTYYISLLYTHSTKDRQKQAVRLMEELKLVDTIADT